MNGANRQQRRHPEHVHATPAAGQPAPTVSISILTAQILLDVVGLQSVASQLRTSQDKLQVGMAQQELERVLAPFMPAMDPDPAEAPAHERSD